MGSRPRPLPDAPPANVEDVIECSLGDVAQWAKEAGDKGIFDRFYNRLVKVVGDLEHQRSLLVHDPAASVEEALSRLLDHHAIRFAEASKQLSTSAEYFEPLRKAREPSHRSPGLDDIDLTESSGAKEPSDSSDETGTDLHSLGERIDRLVESGESHHGRAHDTGDRMTATEAKGEDPRDWEDSEIERLEQKEPRDWTESEFEALNQILRGVLDRQARDGRDADEQERKEEKLRALQEESRAIEARRSEMDEQRSLMSARLNAIHETNLEAKSQLGAALEEMTSDLATERSSLRARLRLLRVGRWLLLVVAGFFVLQLGVDRALNDDFAATPGALVVLFAAWLLGETLVTPRIARRVKESRFQRLNQALDQTALWQIAEAALQALEEARARVTGPRRPLKI